MWQFMHWAVVIARVKTCSIGWPFSFTPPWLESFGMPPPDAGAASSVDSVPPFSLPCCSLPHAHRLPWPVVPAA
jgi:hypothetical protein